MYTYVSLWLSVSETYIFCVPYIFYILLILGISVKDSITLTIGSLSVCNGHLLYFLCLQKYF